MSAVNNRVAPFATLQRLSKRHVLIFLSVLAAIAVSVKGSLLRRGGEDVQWQYRGDSHIWRVHQLADTQIYSNTGNDVGLITTVTVVSHDVFDNTVNSVARSKVQVVG